MIVLDKVGKAYRDRKTGVNWVFRGLNGSFADHENHAVLAPRGQGKTMLLNVISGNDTPSEGQIHRSARVSYPMDFRGAMAMRLTARQNLRFLTDVYGRNYAEAVDFCSAFAEMDRQLDLPLSSFPNQARARFFISAFLALKFDHVLVDEMIGPGDQKFRRKCVRYLLDNTDSITLLLATSDADYASKLCQSASVLHQGKLTFYDTFDEAREAFAEINKVYV